MIPKKYKQKVAKEGKEMWLNRKSNVSTFISFLNSIYPSFSELKVLDAGCAQGRDSEEMRVKGLNVSGLDLNKSFIEEAKKLHPKIHFKVGGIENLPYEDNSFDVVYCVNILFYTDVSKSLPELERVLKTGGVAFITLDRKIVDLEKEEVIHELDTEKALTNFSHMILIKMMPQERTDMIPFKHIHDFDIICLKKD